MSFATTHLERMKTLGWAATCPEITLHKPSWLCLSFVFGYTQTWMTENPPRNQLVLCEWHLIKNCIFQTSSVGTNRLRAIWLSQTGKEERKINPLLIPGLFRMCWQWEKYIAALSFKVLTLSYNLTVIAFKSKACGTCSSSNLQLPEATELQFVLLPQIVF